ncbi:CoA ester lyase [Dactylosporangium sp. NPDC050688]|uniref:HpcH/HpaI aldolase/citrate lyase family protein n=1 Tax=Dactylosporangium sp. NPDC050688 TaxID=3157217 RepID=UPI0034053E99
MLIRSLLVVPPLKPDVVAKAVRTSADALLIELEDGIHHSRKNEARAAVADFLRSDLNRHKPAIVRINDVLHPFGMADIEALTAADATDLMLPKIRTLADVERADALLRRAEGNATRPMRSVRLWVMMETTEAILNAKEIAAHPRVRGLLFGPGDLSAELFVRRIGLGAERAIWDFPLELLYAKQHTLLAARAAGVVALDTSPTNFRDIDATTTTALAAAQMGFDGLLVLSPRQIPPVHAALTPSDADYAWAMAAIKAVQAAEENGETVAVLDGEMIEGPLVRNAVSIVRRYELAHTRHPAESAPPADPVAGRAR